MNITKTCLTCNGTGQIEHGTGTRTCYSCKGEGTSDGGEVSNASQTLDERITEIEDKIDDIMTKCNDIFEKLE